MKRYICEDQDHLETTYTTKLFQPPPAKHISKSQTGLKRAFGISCSESRNNFNTVDFVPAPLFKHFNSEGSSINNDNSTLGYQFLVDHNIPSYTLRPYGNSFTPISVSPSTSPGTEHSTREPSEVFIFYKNYKKILYYSNQGFF